MDTPGVWSENIVRNFERMIDWCESVILMTDITQKNFEYFTQKCAFHIDDEYLQASIHSHGDNFGLILSWISNGIKKLNSNPRVPKLCALDVTFDPSQYDHEWTQHINGDKQILTNLNLKITEILVNLKAKLHAFHDECSDEYSSYSDYSEETTSSEDLDDEDDEDDESLRHKKHSD